MSSTDRDASAVVALLPDCGSEGQWVAEKARGTSLLAPNLVGFETSNIIRRLELAGLVNADLAALAHGDLLDLTIEQWPYELLGGRVWELRVNLTSYDASYVAGRTGGRASGDAGPSYRACPRTTVRVTRP